MPKVLWIELTSKCPYDCIFCTRKIRFGEGRHLDFDIYKSLINELDFPEFIGLNYSGESIFYPHLIEAIQLANSTGASSELVTAFSTISVELLRAIVKTGLDRLAISLHTMDARQYRDIYRLATLELLKERVDDLLRIKLEQHTDKPRLDFCFVAIHENLDQLIEVARYAGHVGNAEIFIHPVIGRHPVSHDFSKELSANKLTDSFKEDLRKVIAVTRKAVPDIPVTVLNPDINLHPRLGCSPAYFAPRLPAGASIHTCDQSPFESVHILANGDVVVCEVHDEVPVGNLHNQSLREIWNGDRYQEFRRKYRNSEIPECCDCVWKMAFLPMPWKSEISAADGMSPQLLRGWYFNEGDTSIWSRRESLLALENSRRAKRIRICGFLSRAPKGKINTLRIKCNERDIGCIANPGGSERHFNDEFLLPVRDSKLFFSFFCEYTFRPVLWEINSDTRDLGFALEKIEIQ
ncbi:MAG: SPASM domain-containing protein [Acidobacteria bacterium]|nr:SPASM domain-containing protein [Acidobacteriota bacterium]